MMTEKLYYIYELIFLAMLWLLNQTLGSGKFKLIIFNFNCKYQYILT